MELIGRSSELAEVAWLLSRAGQRGTGLSIVAAAGTGKTALLDAAAEEALGLGYRVLRCAGVEAETAFAYSALSDLLASVLAEVGDRLPPPQRRALEVVALRADPAGESVEPQAVARATQSALMTMTARTPVVVIVDDAHWLDAESRRALAFAARRLADEPVGLLVASRPHPDAAADALRAALRSLGEGCRELELAPLGPSEVEQLLLHHRRDGLPRSALRRIQRLANGNPLFALELARVAASAPEGPITVPPSIGALLASRIDALPSDSIAVVGAAAQMASPSRSLLRAVATGSGSLAAGGVDSAVDAAIDADVLVEVNGSLRFAHPLLAEAAWRTTTLAFRRHVHRQLADAITDVQARAVHLAMANDEPNADVADAIEAGGALARERAAPEIAAELLAAALRLTPPDDHEGRRRRRVACAYHWVAAGGAHRALSLLAEAVEDEPPGETRVDLEWRQAMLHFLAGDLATSVALLSRAATDTTDAARREELCVRLASMHCWMARFGEAAAICDRIDLTKLQGVARVNALANRVFISFATGRRGALHPEDVLREFEALDSPPPAHEHPVSRLVWVMLSEGSPDAVAAMARPALEAAIGADDDIGTAWNGAALARALVHAGRWSDAGRVAEEALRAGRRAASAPARVYALEASSVVAAYRGDVASARALAAELIDVGAQEPYMMCVESGRLVRGFVALSVGDAHRAAEEMTAAVSMLAPTGVVEPTLPSLRWFLLEALIDAGQTADAEAALDDLARFASEHDHALATAMSETARGRLAAWRGDCDASDAAFARARTAHARLGWPFEHAVTVFALGRSYRQTRRRALAREALADAAARFHELGAPLWEERARAELSSLSGRAPVGSTDLTDTERRVAQLAAAGLKNQEIADRLFVSTKTVATHLGHVYAKLQLRSRTELARHLAGGDQPARSIGQL